MISNTEQTSPEPNQKIDKLANIVERSASPQPSPDATFIGLARQQSEQNIDDRNDYAEGVTDNQTALEETSQINL